MDHVRRDGARVLRVVAQKLAAELRAPRRRDERQVAAKRAHRVDGRWTPRVSGRPAPRERPHDLLLHIEFVNGHSHAFCRDYLHSTSWGADPLTNGSSNRLG